jgi:hypothetical protein
MRAEGDLISKPCIRLLLVDNHHQHDQPSLAG